MADIIESKGRRALTGALAGVGGIAALTVAQPIERAVAGRPLPFRPTRIVAALAGGRELRGAARLGVAAAVQLAYGSALGATFALARPWLSRRRSVRVATFAATVGAAELLTLPPLLGRRPLLRPRVLAALGLHIGLFAVVVDASVELIHALVAER